MEVNNISQISTTTTQTQDTKKTEQSKLSSNLLSNTQAFMNLENSTSNQSGDGFGILSALKNMVTSCQPKSKTLIGSVDSENCINVAIEGGYNVKFLGKEQALTITTPQGTTTKIWGDPHVIESDGDKWDFKNQSTFKVGNAKITIETTPYEADKTKTVMKTVTIFCNDERFTVTDIDKDKPNYVAWSRDGKSIDDNISDGDTFCLNLSDNNKRETWSKK